MNLPDQSSQQGDQYLSPTESFWRLVCWLAVILLGVAGLIWWQIIGGVYTSKAFSNSFSGLSSHATTVAFYVSVASCLLAAILAIGSILFDRASRWLAIAILVVSLGLIPMALLVANCVDTGTVPAKLRE